MCHFSGDQVPSADPDAAIDGHLGVLRLCRDGYVALYKYYANIQPDMPSNDQ